MYNTFKLASYWHLAGPPLLDKPHVGMSWSVCILHNCKCVHDRMTWHDMTRQATSLPLPLPCQSSPFHMRAIQIEVWLVLCCFHFEWYLYNPKLGMDIWSTNQRCVSLCFGFSLSVVRILVQMRFERMGWSNMGKPDLVMVGTCVWTKLQAVGGSLKPGLTIEPF